MRLTSIARKVKDVLIAQPLYVIPLARGGAPYKEDSIKIIRFIRQGCANRPFFHIAVQEANEQQYGKIIEQVGTYDPFPNKYNEKLVALNLARIQHWLDKGALVSLPMKRLLGLSGYFPIHPRTYRDAWFKRKMLMDTLAELEAAAAHATAEAASSGGDDKSESEPSKEPTPES